MLFRSSSNDNTRPTTVCVFPFGVGDTCVVDVVGESVFGVSLAGVGADSFVADPSTVGATLVSVCGCAAAAGLVDVGSELGTVGWVCTVTGEDWVVWTDVVEVGLVGLAGFTGDTGFVGLVTAFLQVSDVVTQADHTGLP